MKHYDCEDKLLQNLTINYMHLARDNTISKSIDTVPNNTAAKCPTQYFPVFVDANRNSVKIPGSGNIVLLCHKICLIRR